MLTHLEPRVSCTACNSLIAPYKIIIYKNVGPDAHIRPLVPDFIKALRSILFPPPCGQGEFGPVRPGGGAGLAIRSSRQYALTPASAPCDKAHSSTKRSNPTMELLLFPFMLSITESAPFQPRRWAYRWRKSCSTRSKGNCVQSGVRCRGGAFVGITSPVKCKNSADSMALSISVTVCHCAGVG